MLYFLFLFASQKQENLLTYTKHFFFFVYFGPGMKYFLSRSQHCMPIMQPNPDEVLLPTLLLAHYCEIACYIAGVCSSNNLASSFRKPVFADKELQIKRSFLYNSFWFMLTYKVYYIHLFIISLISKDGISCFVSIFINVCDCVAV